MPRTARLDPQQVATLLQTGASTRDVAARLGCTRYAVQAVIDSWRARPASAPPEAPAILAGLAARHRNPGRARALKRQRTAGHLAAIGVPADQADTIAATLTGLADDVANAAPARRSAIPPVPPTVAARAAARGLPAHVHPRSARATRLPSTRAARRAWTLPGVAA